MNIAMNEDFRVAYEHSGEVFPNVKNGRDSLVEVNEILAYIRTKYVTELVVYFLSFVQALLRRFQGYLVTDAYAGYEKAEDIKRVLYWSYC